MTASAPTWAPFVTIARFATCVRAQRPVLVRALAMQLSKFAYQGKGAAQSRPKPPMRVGTARWDALDNDALHEIFKHFDDRGLGRLAQLDQRTRRVAHAAMKVCLGLGDSQWEVFKAVLHRRENVLITGSPGCGKSFLLKVLKDRMPRVLVTASTGAASEKIDSFTLHSALGLGLGDKPADEIVRQLKRRDLAIGVKFPQPCQTCDALIIDEVSMLTAKTLDLAAEVMLSFRKKLPQLVVSGDPMQLGAVRAEKDGAFYTSELISKLRPYVLTESFRQTEDSKFLSILNRARLGCAREYDRAWLEANASADVGPDAPRLFSKNHQVWEYNKLKLATIQAPELGFAAEEWGNVPGTVAASGDQNYQLLVKVGARVMLTSNLTEWKSVHNGSCGVVTSIQNGSIAVRFDNGKHLQITRITHEYKKNDEVVGTRTMHPLVLAWAVSIHRAQGATLDRMVTDLSECFAKGQAYVALSRVREIQHLALQGDLKLHKLNNVDKKALGWYEECKARSERRSERHRARDKKAERDAYNQGVDDTALSAMMDAFEAARGQADVRG